MASVLHLNTLHGRQAIHADAAADPRGLADLLARHGLALNTRCCGRALCKGCAVVLESGALRDTRTGGQITGPAELLACAAEWIPETEVSLTIPSRSLLAHKPAVAEDFQIKVPIGNDPLFAGDYGLAVDIGTTTVVVLLAELATGKILSRASEFNQQIRMGDDVLSRIQLCATDPASVARLQAAICRDTILPLAREACARAGVPMERMGGMAIAGNSTMLHLLFGVDPSPMGIAPFTPRFLEARVQSAGSLGLCGLPEEMPVHALPGLAAYVGADIAAGIFATGLHYEARPTLFVDVGTNGEIVLLKDGHLFGCATAAGPAFEGSGLTCGMRATEGAIEGVVVTRSASGTVSVELKTIGNRPLAQAPGICGSAYIDFLAQARACGVLLESGRFDPEA
ncbi:MAG: ASKHA domain-containing protein, partial [Chthoniobacteraceae bacterium]|nr:ASKHA domain-containing protein [Chthoniobacteraceae bacterium]